MSVGQLFHVLLTVGHGACDPEIPICMNRDAGSYQHSQTWDQVISRSRAPSRCKQSTRREQDFQRTSKRSH